jgi:superfamily I DNA and/or RNA helicase
MQNLLNAYNANFGSLNDSYLAALEALGLNYADTEALLNGRLANSQDALEKARERAMQEAYISRMMDQKNIEDYLSAAGFSGGATESVLSDILNTYRNNRNKIEENTQTSLRELLQSYLDNMSNARQAYNSGVLNAENNRMSAAQNLANGLYESQANAASNYANQRANVYGNLYDTLARLALKG